MSDWKAWKGEGPAPVKWVATNPETGATTIVYRDYSAFCWD